MANTLKIRIPDDGLVNWMVINNSLYMKRETNSDFEDWNGILFDLSLSHTKYVDDQKNYKLQGVQLYKDTTKVHFINVQKFLAGDFLYIVLGAADHTAGSPTWKPREDALQLWYEGLHKHAESCKGGIVLWKHRESEVILTLARQSDANRKKYEFECQTTDNPVITHYHKDNTEEVLSSQGINKIDFTTKSDPHPKDVLNPPRYP